MKFFQRHFPFVFSLLLLLCLFLIRLLSPAMAGSQNPSFSVLIDVGHGGFDPGKVVANHLPEKDINLQIALALKPLLEQQDCIVLLDRETDLALCQEDSSNKKIEDMEARISLVQEHAPDIVVSLHQNSYPDPSVSGPQVFYQENSSSGKCLAALLQQSLIHTLNPPKKRVEKSSGDYYLLLHTPCPTVIVECGFLSNPTEASLLESPYYQQQVAYAIAKGILQYRNTENKP